jgi:1-acyl-sn-glycerol-3-phosphate acyltransferase
MFTLERTGLAKMGVEAARRLVYAFARLALRLDVKGLEHLPSKGPYLLCPNHTSLMDGPLVFVSLPFRVLDTTFFLGAESRFQSPFMKWLARVGRVIPTATSDTMRASLQRTAEAISMGRQVCIFPEGEVSRDGRLRPPRTGAGILACELSVPLVPVLIRGTFRSLSITHPAFRWVPVGVTIGPLITPPRKDVYLPQDYQSVVDRWWEAIAAMRREDDASGGPTAGESPRVEVGEVIRDP